MSRIFGSKSIFEMRWLAVIARNVSINFLLSITVNWDFFFGDGSEGEGVGGFEDVCFTGVETLLSSSEEQH